MANMSGAVPHTFTWSLTNATLPCARKLADLGVEAALADGPAWAGGLNTYAGTTIHDGVAAAFA